jgi:flagellar biosynthesis protein FlhB
MQVRPMLAWKAVQIDFSRILPSKGLKKIFSSESISNLALMIAKALLIGLVLFTVILSYAPSLIGLPMGEIGHGLSISLKLISSLFLWSVLVLTVISVGDYALKHHAWKKRLYMSETEVKRENIESNGNPIIKQAIKKLQSEDDDMGKMFKNIRFCNVLVVDTNRRVVGLYFNARFNPEPVALVVASGQTAERVLEASTSYNKRVTLDNEFVEILFGMVRPGSPIPAGNKDTAMQLIYGA